jgi:signal transduction histidine kinase
MKLKQSTNGIEPDIRVVESPPDPAPASATGGDDHAPISHSVQFYEDDAVLLEGLSRFIGSALVAGDAAVVIATKPHRDGLEKLLRSRGLDVDLVAGQGRYVSMDAAEALSEIVVDGQPDEERFTRLVGELIARATSSDGRRTRVAAFGEMVALLWAEGKHEEAVRLEQLWSDLVRAAPIHIHCAYPMSLFSRVDDGEPLERICAEHTCVLPTESYTSLTSEADRLGAIALLQQKAQALETEMEEHRKVQAALRRRETELRRAIVARDQFLAVAAHELKTPITSLRAFAQLLLRDARLDREIAPERLESALRVIELQSGKLANLVRRLLDSAQIEAGRLRIEPVRTDLVPLVLSALAPHQNSDGCTVAFEGPEQLEAEVDPMRFEQVVANLVDNAIKFSPESGVVTVELGQQADGSVRLSVTDQGVGIPSDQRKRVFERSRRARIDDHRSGLGLGLYVSQAIVESHGGLVRIEDPDHPGSRFVVTLPPPADGAEVQPAA